MKLHEGGLWFAKRASYLWGYVKAPIVLFLCAGTRAKVPLFVGRSPRLQVHGRLELGGDFRTRSNIVRSFIAVAEEGTLRIGDNVSLNQGVCIHAERNVWIGDRVAIGDAVRIYDTNFHPVRPGQQTRTEPVKIGDDVWIGVGAIILPGTRVGRGSVIGAGAIVSGDIPEGSLVLGPKAQVVSTFEVPLDFRRRR